MAQRSQISQHELPPRRGTEVKSTTFLALTGRNGVDVCLDEMAEYPFIPSCPHGPMLLFRRYGTAKNGKPFFACSCCRDRKVCFIFRLFSLQDCDFFQWADSSSTGPSQKEILMSGSAGSLADHYFVSISSTPEPSTGSEGCSVLP
jgi:hypothetical protein